MLLTGKANFLPLLPESLDIKMRSGHVQLLSDVFWEHWTKDYLQTLEQRRKWREERPDIKSGDRILLKDAIENRTNWPISMIIETFESSDGKIRKARVILCKDEENVTYTRPFSEMVLLMSSL
jgi:hypothetical protein